MLIPFFEALTETVLMVVLSLIFSVILAFPCAYVLIYAYLLDNPLSKYLANIIAKTLNLIKLAPFLLIILFIVPYLNMSEQTLPNYLGALIPLTIISSFLLINELYTIATIQSQKILELGQKFAANPTQIILLMLLPNNASSISISLGKIAALLVGYSIIAGALGLGGIGELVISENLEDTNSMLLICCIGAAIAFSKAIDYTFGSFTKIIQKR